MVIFIAAILITMAESEIIRKDFPIPPKGVSLNMTFSTNSEISTSISSMNINVFKEKVTATQNDEIHGPELSMIENFRQGIIESKLCPREFIKSSINLA